MDKSRKYSPSVPKSDLFKRSDEQLKPVKPAELRQVPLSAAGVSSGPAGATLTDRKGGKVEGLEATEPVRILVADDNPINRSVATRMLEKRGYVVFAVTNGQEALDTLDREHMDVVFMDCQMQVMDGFDAARTIRVREQRTGDRTPIIAVTAQAIGEIGQLCLAEGLRPGRIGSATFAARNHWHGGSNSLADSSR